MNFVRPRILRWILAIAHRALSPFPSGLLGFHDRGRPVVSAPTLAQEGTCAWSGAGGFESLTLLPAACLGPCALALADSFGNRAPGAFAISFGVCPAFTAGSGLRCLPPLSRRVAPVRGVGQVALSRWRFSLPPAWAHMHPATRAGSGPPFGRFHGVRPWFPERLPRPSPSRDSSGPAVCAVGLRSGICAFGGPSSGTPADERYLRQVFPQATLLLCGERPPTRRAHAAV